MASSTDGWFTVLDECRISAPPNTVGERSLPLTFFDTAFLFYHPVHQLFFYDFLHSKTHFIQTLVPCLKRSLSLTLQHFFPFAGNLIVFPAPYKPQIRHEEGDAVALTFAECSLDFDDLVGNHPRDCNLFHPLVPRLKTASKVSDSVKIPIFSVQVTVFPNSGIAIGLTNHHVLCDARTRYDFLRAWSSIQKNSTDGLTLSSLPLYDRVIKYPRSLDDKCLVNLSGVQVQVQVQPPCHLVPEADRVRATFVLTRPHINTLRQRLPKLEYISSFTVACGFVWACMAKSRVDVEGKKGEYEVERFICMIDWRGRMDPALTNYFGNCVGPSFAETKTSLLTGDEGFVRGVELVGKAISESLKNKQQGMLKDAETWLDKLMVPVPTMGVTGTPKLNVYDVDFRLGKPKKYETVSLDFSRWISVNASRQFPDGLEIGLSLPTKQMDAFLTVSANQLESMLLECNKLSVII